jgi:hypothetical protein
MFAALERSQESKNCVAECDAVESRAARVSRPFVGGIYGLAATVLLGVSVGQAFGQDKDSADFRFVNVADSTQGFTGFSTFPTINNYGTVAFEATQPGAVEGVFKWQDGSVKPIAKSGAGVSGFGLDPAINASGVVAFEANVASGAREIFVNDGVTTKTVVNSIDQGLIGRFMGSPSINRDGTVAFFGTRNGFTSQAIFTGDGGPLTTVLDTLNSNFTGFQNVAINSSDKIVFVGDVADGSEGMFVVGAGKSHDPADQPIDIVDTNNPDFDGFGDPVINRHGTVANDVFRTDGNAEILSGDRRGITARTDVAGAEFGSFEHPSINDSDAVAFFASKVDGNAGVFLELTGGARPIPVIQTGDKLFGGIVTSVDLGRFALNDKFQMAFQYSLDDGRSGVAIASLRRDEREGDDR